MLFFLRKVLCWRNFGLLSALCVSNMKVDTLCPCNILMLSWPPGMYRQSRA